MIENVNIHVAVEMALRLIEMVKHVLKQAEMTAVRLWKQLTSLASDRARGCSERGAAASA